MVLWVNKKELEHFLPLIPPDLRGRVKNGQWFCLGAVSEPENVASGVMLFSSQDIINSAGEIIVLMQLHWIYVAEKFRKQGIGKELIKAFTDVCDDNPAEGIICQLPIDSEYDDAEAFLSSCGFSFKETGTNEMIVTKDDIEKAAKFNTSDDHVKNSNIKSVMELSDAEFTKALNRIKNEEKNIYSDSLSYEKEDYASDVSVVYISEGEVSSIVLFTPINDENLQLLALYSADKNGAGELLKLLDYAAEYFFRNYPSNSKVYITFCNEKSKKLADYVFPEKKTITLRAGLYKSKEKGGMN